MIRNFSRSFFTDPAARKEAVRTEIQNRLSALGAKGIYKQLRLKAVMAFGRRYFRAFLYVFIRTCSRYGADRLSDAAWQSLSGLLGRLQSAPVCQPVLYRSFFVLLCKGGFPKERTAGGSSDRSAVCLRSDAVLMLWEVHPRYTINYFSYLIMLATWGCSGSGQKGDNMLTNFLDHKLGKKYNTFDLLVLFPYHCHDAHAPALVYRSAVSRLHDLPKAMGGAVQVLRWICGAEIQYPEITRPPICIF